MSNPFIGEIRMFGGNFAPTGWAFCDGSEMAISQNDTLFNLIGTTYGGDGVTTFNLPDLRGRLPVHQGTGSEGAVYALGQTGGVETVTLTAQQMPSHLHAPAAASADGTQGGPGGNVLAGSSSVALYSSDAPNTTLDPSVVANAGGSQPHDNRQPSLCVSFIISLFGIYPSPT